MANTFLTDTTITRTALALLSRQVVLPQTVNMSAQANYAGRVGDTINIRKPASASGRVYTDTLRTAGTPITVDDLTETSVALQLDSHIYSAVSVTDEQLTLKLQDFAEQVLQPQIVAVAEDAEEVLAAKLNAVSGTAVGDADGSTVFDEILDMKKALDTAKVPQSNRWLAVSSAAEIAILRDAQNRLVRYEASGDSPNVALREARIGKLYGFNVVSSIALTAGSMVAYHADAFAFATVAPVVPDGANFGKSVTFGGMALRWLRDYDAAFLRDRSIVSVLAGAATADTNRVVRRTGLS